MTSTRTGTTWIAAHRSAVIDPQEAFKLFEVRSFTDQTVRQTLRPAGGGEALRVRLSNLYGRTPLDIGGAHLARRTEGSAIDPATDVTLLFAGAETVTVPPGEEIISDPVEGPVTAGEELALSLYLPGDTGLTTHTAIPYDVGHAVPGDQLTAASLDESDELITGHFVTGIDVLATDNTRIAVAFGDSWIEGMATTPGTGSSFPAQLDRRLTDGWVVATGISGNRLLTDEIGAHLLSRVDHDVLDIPGASHVIIHAGLNDLGLPGAIAFPEPAKLPTAADLTTALTTLADRLHTAGLTVIGATLGPYSRHRLPRLRHRRRPSRTRRGQHLAPRRHPPLRRRHRHRRRRRGPGPPHPHPRRLQQRRRPPRQRQPARKPSPTPWTCHS